MNIQTWPVDRPLPYARNPRSKKTEAAAIEKVAASLKEFGWQQPLVVDREGVLVAGHTRLAAAKKLGWKEVPVVVADELTPEQVKAYRIADNRTQEEAEWNRELLASELEGLQLAEFPISSSAFDQDEVAGLLAGRGELLEPRGDAAARVTKLAKQRRALSWGRINVPMTPEEQEMLNEAYDRYLSEHESEEGFAAWLATPAEVAA